MRRRSLAGVLAGGLVTAGALAAVWSAGASATRPATTHAASPPQVMQPLGHPPESFGGAGHSHGGHGGPPSGGGGSVNLYYHGGVGGIGVETTPKVYLVLWGSQWNGNDPSGEASILTNFLSNVGGSSWLNSVTQYCQGSGVTTSCNSSDSPAGNPNPIFTSSNVWYDNTAAAPSRASQSQLAAEAVAAAAHFNNTSASSNAPVQYVIATATGDNPQGFGHQYCAWHSSTSSSYGNIAYTNLPYITDAGASCGANFNGLGADAGITIVEGHELAETITDQFPNGGWLDSNGEENGDKCAWNSATSNQQMGTNGPNFPVQPLWSNATSACVLSYP